MNGRVVSEIQHGRDVVRPDGTFVFFNLGPFYTSNFGRVECNSNNR